MPTFLLPARQRFFQPQNGAVQETELAYQPGQLVDEDQPPHEEQQGSAKEFDGVEILSEALIESEKLSDAQRRQQEGDSQPGGVDGERQNPAGDGVAGRGEGKHGSENWPDAGRPAKSKSEAEEETAKDTGLRGGTAKMNIAIEPLCESRAKESDDRERKKVDPAEAEEERAVTQDGCDTQNYEDGAGDCSGAETEFHQHADQVQTEKQDQRTGNGREQRAVLPKKSADGARRSAK